MTVAILSMLSIKSLQNSQNLLKDPVVCNSTFESMKWFSITCLMVALSR
jgi:hypothetical protein